jgi:hypothetical protein
MDFKMNKKLDALYYRTPATPSLCGPYKTVTTYNSCNSAQAEKTQEYSRTDYTMDKSKSDKMISAADQSLYKQIIQYPKSLPDIIGSNNENVQRTYVKKLITKFPNLEDVLKPLYPKLFTESAEGYEEMYYRPSCSSCRR